MPERTRRYEKLVKGLAKRTFPEPLAGPVILHADFYCHNRQRRDVDNLLKSIMDGINGVAFADDSQVVSVHASKLLSKSMPRAVITVSAISDIQALCDAVSWSIAERLCSEV